jgi:hypothetical protein
MSIVFTHYCLDGATRPGQEFDCTACRTMLLEAFRSSPGAPSHRPDVPQQDGPRPHLVVPGDSAPTVELDIEPEDDPYGPEAGTTEPDADGEVHTTVASTTPFRAQPGGVWKAVCTCGWSAHGMYRHESRAWAAGVARRHADHHREEFDA